LKFHPDKNHAPGATDAFKKIGNAYAVLSNPEKRKQYDLTGNEEQACNHQTMVDLISIEVVKLI